jgi:hypothetical protein
MKLVFISGAYRGDIDANIEHAKQASIRLWKEGYAVICPHMNTAHFDGICPDEVWLEGDLEILSRCDIVYVLNNWTGSEGSKAEIELARKLKIPVFYEPNI